NNTTHALNVHRAGIASSLTFDGAENTDQLGNGWWDREGDVRWAAPNAKVRLLRPEDARCLRVRLVVVPGQVAGGGGVTIGVSVNGVPLELKRLTAAGWQAVFWELPPSGGGTTSVSLTVEPPFHAPGDARTLGVAIGEIGFGGCATPSSKYLPC